jgi:hypothetical protein
VAVHDIKQHLHAKKKKKTRCHHIPFSE